jgi:hypothetical protein
MPEGSGTTSTETVPDRGSRVRVPAHVVHRSFPTETVVLNLETGIYHGLNPTAGRMLETVERAETIGRAAALLAAEFEQPRSLVERDLCELCRALLERGLVVLDAEG